MAFKIMYSLKNLNTVKIRYTRLVYFSNFPSQLNSKSMNLFTVNREDAEDQNLSGEETKNKQVVPVIIFCAVIFVVGLWFEDIV